MLHLTWLTRSRRPEGVISFALQGANVPGAAAKTAGTPPSKRSNSRIYARQGLFDFVSGAIDGMCLLESSVFVDLSHSCCTQKYGA